jgi:hypothetical protein
MQLILSKYDAALQNQQAKACWKRCKTPRKVQKFSVYAQKISSQQIMIEKYIFDLSKTNISAEK